MVILLGIPVIVVVVIYLRQQRIQFLIDNSMDKLNNDVDALIHINMIKDLSISRNKEDSQAAIDLEMKVKGIINLHFEECKQEQCICKNLLELYDCAQQQYLTPT